MKLIALSLAALVATVMIFATIRFWGLGQPVTVYDSDFWKLDGATNSIPSLILNAKTPADLENPQVQFIALDVTERDSSLWCFDNLSLTEVLKKYPQKHFFLNLKTNVSDVHEKAAAAIDEAQADKRVAIASEYDIILTALHKMKPTLIYGTSQSDLMKLAVYSDLLIAPATPMHADFAYLPLKHRNQDVLDESMIKELRRRKMHIFIYGIHSESDWTKALALKADGYVTDDMSLGLSHLK